MIDVLGALMGIDMQGFSRPEGSDDLPPGAVPGTIPDPPSSPPPKAKAPTPQPSPSKPSPPPEPAKVEEVVEMEEDEDDEEVKARKEAEAEKKLGAEAYKKRDFEVAATHFSKAWDIWPKDITFLTNLGGRWQTAARSERCSDLEFAQLYTSKKAITRSVSKLVKKLSKKVVGWACLESCAICAL